MKRFILAIYLLAFLLAGCSTGPISKSKGMLGTQVTITAHVWRVGVDRHGVEAAIDSAFREIKRVEELSWHDEMERLNYLSGVRPFDIGEELTDMILQAYDIGEETYWSFRPDMGPMIDLWGFGSDSVHIPNMWDVDSVMTIIDSTIFTIVPPDSISNVEQAILHPKGAKLDLGGYAKGYAVDRAVDKLREQGIVTGIVEAGGDLRCFGAKEDDTPWRIAIRHPRKLDEFYTILSIDSGAVATSGDYEQYLMVDNFRYHHILNPVTGFPAKRSVSATVVAKSCAEADAYATGFFVMGPHEGIGRAEDLGLHALIISEVSDSLQALRTHRFSRVEEDTTKDAF
ncbi:FAD:protein FMN transferase [bacterium]|nr:FAD:protein FMN transferase [bacterium]